MIITVSEPWDFTNKSGKNTIVGTLKKVLNDTEAIFESDDLIHIGNNEGRLFFLKSRYSGTAIESVPVTVNAGFVDPSLDYNSCSPADLMASSHFAFVGTLCFSTREE